MLTIFRPSDSSRNDPFYLTDYADLCVEHKLVMDERTLSFSTTASNVNDYHILVEGYIRYDSAEYVIKEVSIETSGKASIVAQMNIEELEWRVWKEFSVINATALTAVNLARDGTGWNVNQYSGVSIASFTLEYVSTYDILKEISSIFRVNFTFNTISKIIAITPITKVDDGAYVSDELNLKNITIQKSTYDTFTELEAYGNGDLTFASINGGKNYITDYTYFTSNRKKRYIWSAPEYTDKGALLAASRLKLEEMAKPLVTIEVDAFDISKVNPDYSFNSIELGKIVTIIDSRTNTFEKEIVTETREYPDDPTKNSYVFANKMTTLTDLLGKTAGNISNVSPVQEDYSLYDDDPSDIFDDSGS